MKTILLLIWWGMSWACLQAQSLNGQWKGILLQPGSMLSTQYSFELNLSQKGNVITGTSVIMMKGKANVKGTMKLRGTFEAGLLRFEETEIVNSDGMGGDAYWCLKKCILRYSVREHKAYLSGEWKGAAGFESCPGGTIAIFMELGEPEQQKHGRLSDYEDHTHAVVGEVELLDAAGTRILERHKTDLSGKFSFQAKPGVDYLMRCYAREYEQAEYNFRVIKAQDDYFFYLKKTPTATRTKLFDGDIHIGDKIALDDVLFEQSRAIVLPESLPALDNLAAFLHENPHLKVEIAGHTDNVGNPWKNLELSRRRAVAVVNHLINKGISSDRLLPKGYGSQQPLTDNSSEEARRKNRRVELKITGM